MRGCPLPGILFFFLYYTNLRFITIKRKKQNYQTKETQMCFIRLIYIKRKNGQIESKRSI